MAAPNSGLQALGPLNKTDTLIGYRTAPTEGGPIDYDFLYKTVSGCYYLCTYDSAAEPILIELGEIDGQTREAEYLAGYETIRK
jgi:hypothetical protein